MPSSVSEKIDDIHGEEKSSSVAEIGPQSIQIENKIYNASQLAEFHPGGRLFVKSFAGRDATTAFISYHRKKFPHKKANFAYESTDYSVTPEQVSAVDSDFLELCDRVHKVLPSHKTFAPWHYYLKIFVILGLSFGLEGYIHWTASYKWYLCAIQGFLFASIGLNVQHDANHGAISKKWWINRTLGASMNYIGHSAVDWVHQHVVQHHVHVNDVHRDPDIEGTPLYRLNPLKPLLKIHAFQFIYYFMIINLYGVTLSFFTIINLIQGAHHTDFSILVHKYWKWETMGSVAMIFRWMILPFWQVPSIWTFFHVIPALAVFGQYVAFFFILSHNYMGVHHQGSQINNRSFLYNQVTCSSNVGGPFLCFLNGGLNYQIEHHLFPRIAHVHYPTIAPVVKQFCQEKGIRYTHFDTITENFFSTAQHLFGLGTEESPNHLKFN